MKRNHDIIEISGEIRRETEKGLLLFDGAREAWLPKAQVENNKDGTFSMPEWLAVEKGFV